MRGRHDGTAWACRPVGVAHYIQKWFRFKLQEWIVSRMREVESKEGLYSLEGWLDFRNSRIAREENPSDYCHLRECVPSLVGEYQDRTGTYLAADVSMIEKPLDISQMSIEWVNSTEDPLFKSLTRKQALPFISALLHEIWTTTW